MDPTFGQQPRREDTDLVSVSYLPMACPKCGRHRLLAYIVEDPPARFFVRRIKCEKCAYLWPDYDEREEDE